MNCRTVFRSSVLSLVCAVSAAGVHGQVEKQKGVEANRELVRRAFQAFEAGTSRRSTRSSPQMDQCMDVVRRRKAAPMRS